MTILETDRLYLREYTENDLEGLSEIFSDEAVMKYIGKGGVLDKAYAKLHIDTWSKKLYGQLGFGLWAMIFKENNMLIGQCGFNILKETSEVEIAYLLAKNYWGKGIATEISGATADYGFRVLSLKKIVAIAYKQNQASINVIRKLGMKYEGEKVFFGKNLESFSLIPGDFYKTRSV